MPKDFFFFLILKFLRYLLLLYLKKILGRCQRQLGIACNYIRNTRDVVECGSIAAYVVNHPQSRCGAGYGFSLSSCDPICKEIVNSVKNVRLWEFYR